MNHRTNEMKGKCNSTTKVVKIWTYFCVCGTNTYLHVWGGSSKELEHPNLSRFSWAETGTSGISFCSGTVWKVPGKSRLRSLLHSFKNQNSLRLLIVPLVFICFQLWIWMAYRAFKNVTAFRLGWRKYVQSIVSTFHFGELQYETRNAYGLHYIFETFLSTWIKRIQSISIKWHFSIAYAHFRNRYNLKLNCQFCMQILKHRTTRSVTEIKRA